MDESKAVRVTLAQALRVALDSDGFRSSLLSDIEAIGISSDLAQSQIKDVTDPRVRVIYCLPKNDTAKFRDVSEGFFIVGRFPMQGWMRINDPSISRAHCLFVVIGSRIVVADLGSRNGVWINNERQKPFTVTDISVNDIICLGDTEMKFVWLRNLPIK